MEKSWIVALIAIAAIIVQATQQCSRPSLLARDNSGTSSSLSFNCLQCYQCENCPKSNLADSDLVTCGGEISTVTPTTVTSSSSVTTSTTESTSTSSTVSPATTSSTTESTTSSSTTESTSTTSPTTSSTTTLSPDALRVRRNIQPDPETDNGCTCFGIQCSCDAEGAIPRVMQYADETYVCAKVTYTYNNTEIISRGCTTAKLGDKEFCTYAKDELEVLNSTLTQCSTCDTDTCNGATAMQTSIAAIVIVLASLFVTK